MENFLCLEANNLIVKHFESEIAQAQVDKNALLIQPYYPVLDFQDALRKDGSFCLAVHPVFENNWIYSIQMMEYFTFPLFYNNGSLVGLLVPIQDLAPISKFISSNNFEICFYHKFAKKLL